MTRSDDSRFRFWRRSSARRGAVSAGLAVALLAAALASSCGPQRDGATAPGITANGSTNGVIAASASAIAAPADAAAPDPCEGDDLLPLMDGDQRTRSLSPAEGHCYEADLAAGELLEVSASQGIDIVLILREPSGAETRFDFGELLPERLVWTAGPADRYWVIVRAYSESDEGQYEFEVRRVTEPDRRQRHRADLFAGLARADQARAFAQSLTDAEAGPAYRRAAELYLDVAEPLQHFGLTHLAAKAWERAGIVLSKAGDLAAASAAFRKAINRYDQLEDPASSARLRWWLGNTARDAGDNATAERAYLEGIECARSAGEPGFEAAMQFFLAGIYSGEGSPALAEPKLEAALGFFRVRNDTGATANALTSLAMLYLDAGRAPEARSRLDEARRIYAEIPQGNQSRGWSADVYVNLLVQSARAYAGTDDVAQARTFLREGLSVARQLGSDRALVELHFVWGDIEYLHREFDLALDHYLTAETVADEIEKPEFRQRSLLSQGRALYEMGRLTEAAERLQRSLSLAAKGHSELGRALNLHYLARVQREQGDFSSACGAAQEAIEILEWYFDGTDRVDLRSSNFEGGRHFFEVAIDVCAQAELQEGMESGLRTAFLLGDRSRARRLRDLLAIAREAGDTSPPSLPAVDPCAELVEAQQHWDALQEGDTREIASDSPGFNSLEQRLQQAVTRYWKRPGARVREGRGSQPVPDLAFLSLEQIQHDVLGPDRLLLQFDLGSDRSYLWALTEGELYRFELGPRKALERDALRFHQLLVEGYEVEATAEIEYLSDQLGQTLLQPLAPLLQRFSHLAIVADGALHYVPFSALRYRDPVSGEVTDLVMSHDVVYPPSSSAVAWLRARQRRQPRPAGRLAVVGDAVFGRNDRRLTGQDSTAAPGEVKGRGSAEQVELPRLVNSQREIESALALVPPGQSLGLEGFAATKQAVRSGALEDYEVLLFSTHGSQNEQYPVLSNLALSRWSEAGQQLDWRLYACELGELRLRADLVVLSACETALGTQIAGEGPVGLTHALLQAGAFRTVVSLWQVDDEASADLVATLMREYFEDGKSPAAAVRAAQLAIRRKGLDDRPFFWAGFVVRGAW